MGVFKKGDKIDIDVMPFRACMLLATTQKYDEPAIHGTDYRVLKNADGQAVEIEILGMPGTTSTISLMNAKQYKSVQLAYKDVSMQDAIEITHIIFLSMTNILERPSKSSFLLTTMKISNSTRNCG